MKIAPNLDFTAVEPEKKSLDAFVQMIKKVYQNFTQAFNGQIGFGDGTNLDNINGSWINVTAPVAPNTDFTVNHNMNRIPSGYWVMQKDRACDVYTGSVAATATQLTLRATVASAVLRLFIIGLLLSILPIRSEAQGANHTNIALKTVIVSGSSGIGGGVVVQPIASAIITVCNGSVIPAAGTTCTGTANIFSNRALTGALNNPTNADLNGNYTFWVSPGPYVVSVGGVGLTTYSYAITPACNPTDTCTTTGAVVFSPSGSAPLFNPAGTVALRIAGVNGSNTNIIFQDPTGVSNHFEFGEYGIGAGGQQGQLEIFDGVSGNFPLVIKPTTTAQLVLTGTNVSFLGSNVIPFNGAMDIGASATPFINLWLGSSAGSTSNYKFQPGATTGARIVTITDPVSPTTVGMPLTIASGSQALNTASITTATCDSGVAATATGTLSTDRVSWSFNAAPTATNKYGAFLVVYAVPSANSVTFYTCNPSATTSTPTAMSVNWSVVR